jgi:hypothetical protein
MKSMNRNILIKGLEEGPPQRAFGDWSFRRLPRKVGASQIRVVGSRGKSDAASQPSNPASAEHEEP